jgi:RHS repeat-associated protein
VVKATDEGQNLVWDAQRKPFGQRVVSTELVEMPLGFPGQYYDQETNNYYNYFRDYDPTTGRYLQSDPIGLAGGLNTYGYVLNNPLNFQDKYGLCPTGGLLCGGLAIGISSGVRAGIAWWGRRAATAGGIGAISEIVDLDKKRKEKEKEKECPPPDPDDEDPCKEWYDELLAVYEDMIAGIIPATDLDKQFYNNAVDTYHEHCLAPYPRLNKF